MDVLLPRTFHYVHYFNEIHLNINHCEGYCLCLITTLIRVGENANVIIARELGECKHASSSICPSITCTFVNAFKLYDNESVFNGKKGIKLL